MSPDVTKLNLVLKQNFPYLIEVSPLLCEQLRLHGVGELIDVPRYLHLERRGVTMAA